MPSNSLAYSIDRRIDIGRRPINNREGIKEERPKPLKVKKIHGDIAPYVIRCCIADDQR